MTEHGTPAASHAQGWLPDPATLALWPRLTPGAAVTIVKADADGAAVTRYNGAVRRVHSAGQWIEASAVWSHGDVTVGGLRFVPGDRLLEYFSPLAPYNVFTVFAPDGSLRGWYANVSWPALVRERGGTLELIWRDLFLDLIAFPDGTHITQDEDELEGSGLAATAPDLYQRIQHTQDVLIQRFLARDYPFSVTTEDTRAD